MPLRCFISGHAHASLSRLKPLLLLWGALVVAGCAATGGSASTDRSSRVPENAAGVKSGAVLHADIPAQAQTMFEQAVAVMAAGDFVEAELRLKEFLLQYPAYPGAYVNLAIIHSQNGDEKAAQASIDAALALNPNHPAALNQQGMLFRRNGNFY